MADLLPQGPAWWAFLAAALVLAITPGPGVLYIVMRSLVQGRAAGWASVAGVALGNWANAVLASLGLAAVLAVSGAAFTLLKLAGVGYLLYLALQALRAPAVSALGPGDNFSPPLGVAWRLQVFKESFWVALLNPKTALFFAAFLPQFMQGDLVSAAAPSSTVPVAQSIALSAVFVLIAACTDSVYVALSAALGPALRAHTGLAACSRYISAAVYLALAVYAAVAEPRWVSGGSG